MSNPPSLPYKNMLKNIFIIPILLSCIFYPTISSATTSTGVLAVSATVLSVCGVVATPMAFGNYSVTSTSPTDATSLITATCTAGVPYTISMNAGIGTGATVDTRVMNSVLGSTTLNYEIYTDSSRTQLWGDGTGSTGTVSGTAGLVPDIYTAYGRIPAGQQSTLGAYVDTVTVTLTY